MSLEDLGFTYIHKDNEVTLFHHGKKATTLRNNKALEFLDDIDQSSNSEIQQLMARLTGNYKRGNEKLAKQKRASRY